MNAPWRSPSVPAPQMFGALAGRRFGAGEPLVLIHGGVGSWTHWTANVESLAQHFALTVIDLPGYGDAADPIDQEPEGYLKGVARDLARAMRNRESFGLVGFSFGAVVCTAIALQLGAHVKATSLLGPGGFGNPVRRNIDLLPVPSLAEDPTGHRAAVAHNLGAFMLSRTPAQDHPVVDLHSANLARVRFDSRRISFQDRLVGDLEKLSCPLQVIWGGEDRLPVPSMQARAERIKKPRPDAEIHFVQGAGHWVQYDAPRAVDVLLTEFHKRVAT
jgi:2-hydroxy-6-oxonona-2,4-dienedioate hydrolase